MTIVLFVIVEWIVFGLAFFAREVLEFRESAQWMQEEWSKLFDGGRVNQSAGFWMVFPFQERGLQIAPNWHNIGDPGA